MTKELSKQLCELCGITRKYCKKCGSRGYIGERYIKEDIFECCMCHCKNFEIKANSDIDFGEPENFVKLGEMTFNYNFGGTVFSFFGKDGFRDRTCMLRNLSEFFRRANETDPNNTCEWLNTFKQTIREAEWKYE